MKTNVGSLDSIVRIVLGILFLAGFIFLDGGIRYAGLLGIVFVVTGILRSCPLYILLGISSCPVKTARK